MSKYITDTQISKMSYNEMGKKLTTGELTEKRLKDYYTSARKKAMDRYRRTSKTTEFGEMVERQAFAKLKNLPTTSALVHEIANVNRYLNSYASTITGLKAHREKVLTTLSFHGFDFVDESNYGDWMRFLTWFKSSDYARAYDSNDEEVADAFTMAEGSTPEEWEHAFKWSQFLAWFRSSVYAQMFDFSDKDLKDIFNSGSSVAEWENAILQYYEDN